MVSACKHALNLAGPAGKQPDAGTTDGYAVIVSNKEETPVPGEIVHTDMRRPVVPQNADEGLV